MGKHGRPARYPWLREGIRACVVRPDQVRPDQAAGPIPRPPKKRDKRKSQARKALPHMSASTRKEKPEHLYPPAEPVTAASPTFFESHPFLGGLSGTDVEDPIMRDGFCDMGC